MSTVQIIQADKVAPQPWRNGGGHTRELLVWPSPASTNATGWRLRISRADIAASGPFSAFEGIQRWFVVLSGNGVVLHMPTPDGHTLDHTLLPGHMPLHFDGGLAPGCTLINGPTQDLNLMARGGSACVLPAYSGEQWTSDHAMCGLYTACSGTWSDGQQTLALAAHTLLWLPEACDSAQPRAPMRFTSDHRPAQAWWLGFTPEASV